MDEGMNNDMELHLAAKRGDLASVKHILDAINSQTVGTLSGADFDAEVAKVRASVLKEVNDLGETALYAAAENGHLEVVKEFLKYADKETLTKRSGLEFDALHVAASQGHHAIVKLLLDHDESLCQTKSQGNATPLITAASKGHTDVVQELLSKDPSFVYISNSFGKNALHLAAKSGHVETVKSLLEKDPQLARRVDKRGQTALHMAVIGGSIEVVKLLLEADAAIAMLPDKAGLTALHVATNKKRDEIVHVLLCLPYTNVNALTKDNETALDIAEGLPASTKSTRIKAFLVGHGVVRASKLNQPRDEFGDTMSQFKKDIHTVAQEVRKLRGVGTNDTNYVTMAVLFAVVALAAVFMVPGGENYDGIALVVPWNAFDVFIGFDMMAFSTSLAVVVIHMTLGSIGKTKVDRIVMVLLNRLMFLACVGTSVAFVTAAYIVVGRKNERLAVCFTQACVAVMVMAIGTMVVLKWKKKWSMVRKEKIVNHLI